MKISIKISVLTIGFTLEDTASYRLAFNMEDVLVLRKTEPYDSLRKP